MSGPHLRARGLSAAPVAALPCTRCRRQLPLEAFRLLPSGSRASWCRACAVAATRAWRAANRDAILARRRQRYAGQKA